MQGQNPASFSVRRGLAGPGRHRLLCSDEVNVGQVIDRRDSDRRLREHISPGGYGNDVGRPCGDPLKAYVPNVPVIAVFWEPSGPTIVTNAFFIPRPPAVTTRPRTDTDAPVDARDEASSFRYEAARLLRTTAKFPRISYVRS